MSWSEVKWIINNINSMTPQIYVTVPSGSTVTCIKGDVSITPKIVDDDYVFNVNDYGVWTLTATKDSNIKIIDIEVTELKQYKIELEYFKLYGYKIDKNDSNPATRVSYLEDCHNADFTPFTMNLTTGVPNYGDWADAFFITGNYPAMVNADGAIAYELDPNDYTKKKDGTTSDVSNTSFNGNAMSIIPKVWKYEYEDTNYHYCYFCDKKLNNNYHCNAFVRADGTEADYAILPLFKGSNVSSKLRSLKGQTPINGQSGQTEINYAKANGNKWYTTTWSQWDLIGSLLVLLGKSTNIQAVFGNGHYNGGSSASSLLQTGGAYDKGQFYGTNGNTYVKVFHLENWYGDRWDRIAGCMTDGNKQILIKPTAPYTDGSSSGYTATGVTPSGTSGGYISQGKTIQGLGFIPQVASGSETTYWADGLWFNTNCYALVGGACHYGFLVGAFCLLVTFAFSLTAWAIGASLSCEQPSA